jgi:hypothetical protein
LVELTMSKPNDAVAAVPVFAVTVHVVPEPLTFVMLAPVPPTSAKFDAVTPATEALKVTVQSTEAFTQAGELAARLIEDTVVVGDVFVKLKLTEAAPFAAAVTV